MENIEIPFITIVHNHDNDYCKLLVLYDEINYWYSYSKSYKELLFFKKPSKIIKEESKIILYSKNGSQTIEIKIPFYFKSDYIIKYLNT